MTHGHQQWCGDSLREWGVLGGEGKRGKIGINVIACTIKYNFKRKKIKWETKKQPRIERNGGIPRKRAK